MTPLPFEGGTPRSFDDHRDEQLLVTALALIVEAPYFIDPAQQCPEATAEHHRRASAFALAYRSAGLDNLSGQFPPSASGTRSARLGDRLQRFHDTDMPPSRQLGATNLSDLRAHHGPFRETPPHANRARRTPHASARLTRTRFLEPALDDPRARRQAAPRQFLNVAGGTLQGLADGWGNQANCKRALEELASFTAGMRESPDRRFE